MARSCSCCESPITIQDQSQLKEGELDEVLQEDQLVQFHVVSISRVNRLMDEDDDTNPIEDDFQNYVNEPYVVVPNQNDDDDDDEEEEII